MSEQELTKLKNKYRLFKILHPSYRAKGPLCALCPHWVWNNKNSKTDCPPNILVLMGDDTGDEWVQEIYRRTTTDFIFCVEWIKHV